MRPKIIPLSRIDHERPTVFFIHDLTGSAVVYRHFAEKMEGCNVFGINQSDCDYKSGVLSIQEMGKIYANEIIRQYPMREFGHYNILGYSLGGILGMEIACELKKEKKKIGFVALIDTPPLSLLNTPPIQKYIELLSGLAKDIFNLNSWEIDFYTDVLQSRISLTRHFISRCEIALNNEISTKHKDQKCALFRKIAHNLLMELILNSSDYSNINPKKVFVFSTKKTADNFGLSEDLGWSQLLGEEFDDRNSVIVLPDSCNHFNIFSNEEFFSPIKLFLSEKLAEIKLTELSNQMLQSISLLNGKKQFSVLEKFLKKAERNIGHAENLHSFWLLKDDKRMGLEMPLAKTCGKSV